jgi:hypothetical protein
MAACLQSPGLPSLERHFPVFRAGKAPLSGWWEGERDSHVLLIDGYSSDVHVETQLNALDQISPGLVFAMGGAARAAESTAIMTRKHTC